MGLLHVGCALITVWGVGPPSEPFTQITRAQMLEGGHRGALITVWCVGPPSTPFTLVTRAKEGQGGRCGIVYSTLGCGEQLCRKHKHLTVRVHQ